MHGALVNVTHTTVCKCVDCFFPSSVMTALLLLLNCRGREEWCVCLLHLAQVLYHLPCHLRSVQGDDPTSAWGQVWLHLPQARSRGVLLDGCESDARVVWVSSVYWCHCICNFSTWRNKRREFFKCIDESVHQASPSTTLALCIASIRRIAFTDKPSGELYYLVLINNLRRLLKILGIFVPDTASVWVNP